MSNNEKIKLLSGKDEWHLESYEDLPSIMVCDGPHGLRKQEDANYFDLNSSKTAVCFPAACGLASSFNTELAKKLGETLGEECVAEDVSVLLGPAVNIKRSPLCGRNFEYFSEDPYLTGEMAKNYINGVQSKGVGTSIKHFAVNNQEKRRMTVSAEVDERALREIYLKGFEIAIKGAQPKTVMCSYNKINGVYSSENPWLLDDVLRKEWGFKGFVMSDWGAVNDRYKGVKAGLDLEMPGSCGIGYRNIENALNQGKLKQGEIDACVERISNVVKDLSKPKKEYIFDRAEHHKIAKEIALETMVLLKNQDDILPLDKNRRILFLGEFAEKPRYQGGGSSHINSYKDDDAFSACKQYGVVYEKGFSAFEDKVDYEAEERAVALAKQAEIVVIFAGLPESFESEGFDRSHMRLPEVQNRFIKRIADIQPNVVVVLHNGSPVEMPWIDNVKGVLEAYLAGEGCGEAVADLLFGKANPSGKLAETFPKHLYDNPSYYNFPGYYNTVEYRESIFVGYRYYDTVNKEVLFPFGFGLSYTEYEYSDLKIEDKTVSFKVKNIGKMKGKEVVELYISSKTNGVFKPEKELKRFAKIELDVGKEKIVSFTLKQEDFAYYNVALKKWAVEAGKYKILIGASSKDIRLSALLKVNGIETVPYSGEVNSIYKTNDMKNITRSDFEKLLGRKVIDRVPEKPYTMYDCLGDADDTKVGKLISVLVKKIAPMITNDGMGNSDVNVAFALEMPMRNLATMTGGFVTEKMRDAIIDLVNDKHFLQSLSTLAKGGIDLLKKEK